MVPTNNQVRASFMQEVHQRTKTTNRFLYATLMGTEYIISKLQGWVSCALGRFIFLQMVCWELIKKLTIYFNKKIIES